MTNGADFIGESIVFLVAGVAVVWEYNLSKDKEKKKEYKRSKEINEDKDCLQAKLNALDARLEALEKAINSNSRAMFLGNVMEKDKRNPKAEVRRWAWWPF